MRCTSASKNTVWDLGVRCSAPGMAESPAASPLDAFNRLHHGNVVLAHRRNYCDVYQGLYSAN